MMPGFLGTRATFMFDFVVVAMAAILPILGWSVYLVKYRRAYALHRVVQLVLAVVLLVAVAAFEIDVRLAQGTDYSWSSLAKASPFYDSGLYPLLYFHLTCSISTVVLWIAIVVLALRNFPAPPEPNGHSALHRPLGWAGVVGMTLTAVTGWIFYYMAFVATITG